MKRLVLIRHGKTEAHSASGADFDRELVPRAYSDGTLMIDHVLRPMGPPERLVVSTARRAMQTGEIITAAIKTDLVAVPNAELYLADPGTVWEVAAGNLCDVDSLWIIGHNPGLLEAVRYCTGEWLDSLPTFGTVAIDFSELVPRRGSLVAVHRPRSFR